MATTPASMRLPAFLAQTKQDIHAKFIDLEWQQRNRLLQGTQSSNAPWSHLPPTDTIAARNRYMNVQPYAANRVRLRRINGAEGKEGEDNDEDYINASPIVLGKRRYIATQGPKENGVGHFYRMLADDEVVKGPVVVVMLTQTHEAGREKCFQYYPLSAQESPLRIPPEEDGGHEFQGEVELEAQSEDQKSRSEIRRLRLRTTSEGKDAHKEKEIHHLLFAAWPDFLVPEGPDRAALLHLIALSASLNTTDLGTQSNPRIIHCSAGVGRSGTFIALDYLLDLLRTGAFDNLPDDQDPIAECVDTLRQQRMMMVQGESQFFFLYEVLKEQWLLYKSGSRGEQDTVVGATTGM